MLRWLEHDDGTFSYREPSAIGWLLASPVGGDARKIALLQCVPTGTRVPGVGRRVRHNLVINGICYQYAFELEDT